MKTEMLVSLAVGSVLGWPAVTAAVSGWARVAARVAAGGPESDSVPVRLPVAAVAAPTPAVAAPGDHCAYLRHTFSNDPQTVTVAGLSGHEWRKCDISFVLIRDDK